MYWRPNQDSLGQQGRGVGRPFMGSGYKLPHANWSSGHVRADTFPEGCRPCRRKGIRLLRGTAACSDAAHAHSVTRKLIPDTITDPKTGSRSPLPVDCHKQKFVSPSNYTHGSGHRSQPSSVQAKESAQSRNPLNVGHCCFPCNSINLFDPSPPQAIESPWGHPDH